MHSADAEPSQKSNSQFPRSRQEVRAVTSGALGSALEFYDFAIYGALAASLFPKLFFQDLGAGNALLASFATFGVGFIARPLGALIFGHLGDRYGRRRILMITLIVMGTSTALIGFLPAGQGMLVASVLVLLRFLQGFSLGGEATGNQLMVIEHAHRSRRGVLSSIVQAGSPASQVFALLTLTILNAVLSESQWESWGWRIPFVGGLIIVCIAAYIRRSLEETPAFLALKDGEKSASVRNDSGFKALRENPARVVRLVIALGGTNFSYYVVAVYGISYLNNNIGLTTDETFFVLMVANAISILAAIAGGIVSDRFGRIRPTIAANFILIIGLALFFGLASSVSLLIITMITSLTLSSVQFTNGIQPTLFAEQFPTRNRFAGSAISLTLSAMIFASFAPLIAAAVTRVGGTLSVFLLTVLLLAISIAALTTLTDNSPSDLASSQELRPRPPA